MPELPEVETVVRQLRPRLQGKKISSVAILDKKVSSPSLKKAVSSTILDVTRRGKYIQFLLSNKHTLLFHLRMTGHFTFDRIKQTHQAAIFHFSDQHSLTFHSIRRFSTAECFTKKQLDTRLQKLGEEPLEISAEDFLALAQKFPLANLKSKLLDQTFVAGVGNIYAQEALYHARVHPHRAIGNVPVKSLRKVFTELQRILWLAIGHNGTTVHNYTNIDGKGDFQQFLAVYNQEKCPQGHQILRMVIQGRGTYYCDECQR